MKLSLALAVFAADITGTWKGSIETPGGTFDNTFVLKADGAKLTGTLQGGPGGELKIEEVQRWYKDVGQQPAALQCVHAHARACQHAKRPLVDLCPLVVGEHPKGCAHCHLRP